ncbi:hypothetical protein Avbf_13677, partial [Armadillidium vulgare]
SVVKLYYTFSFGGSGFLKVRSTTNSQYMYILGFCVLIFISAVDVLVLVFCPSAFVPDDGLQSVRHGWNIIFKYMWCSTLSTT